MTTEIYKCPKCDVGQLVEIVRSNGRLECNFCNFYSYKTIFTKGVKINE